MSLIIETGACGWGIGPGTLRLGWISVRRIRESLIGHLRMSEAALRVAYIALRDAPAVPGGAYGDVVYVPAEARTK